MEIVAVGCRDISDAQASIVSPFTVSFIRGDTSNQIGCDVTCAGKDAKASWQLTDGDADGRRGGVPSDVRAGPSTFRANTPETREMQRRRVLQTNAWAEPPVWCVR